MYFPFSRIAEVALRRELGESSTILQIEGTLGLFLIVLGVMWLVILGESSYGTIEMTIVFLVGCVMCTLAYQSAYRVGGGRHW
jgi:4-hydroxybenzoate polyprenyltransferase